MLRAMQLVLISPSIMQRDEAGRSSKKWLTWTGGQRVCAVCGYGIMPHVLVARRQPMPGRLSCCGGNADWGMA